MVRTLALFGFGGVFLMISPNLRGILAGGFAAWIGSLEQYSPWSYVACVIAGLLVAGVCLNRGSRPT